jgi:hypothetical protein
MLTETCMDIHIYFATYVQEHVEAYIYIYIYIHIYLYVTALLLGGLRDRSPVVSLGMFSVATDGTICPGVDSASRNEYQENSLG